MVESAAMCGEIKAYQGGKVLQQHNLTATCEVAFSSEDGHDQLVSLNGCGTSATKPIKQPMPSNVQKPSCLSDAQLSQPTQARAEPTILEDITDSSCGAN